LYDVPLEAGELAIHDLGRPRFRSPLRLPAADPEVGGSFVADGTRILLRVEMGPGEECDPDPLAFEKAGPRPEIFFDPPRTRAAMVTCGGLCPGTNNVIRSIFNELYYRYGVKEILGVRYGFSGLAADSDHPPLELTPSFVKEIHAFGGTFLGSSRGAPEVSAMVDYLDRELGVDILFCIGGDGTQRGAHALAEEIARRQLAISVVGVPKTIDNDIPFVYRSFGFFTALEKAWEVIQAAHTEAVGARNGVGLVKLMGRDAGYIAAGATLVSQQVNYCLIPEVPFCLEGEGGFLPALEQRLVERGHAVVVIAEGAGQHLFDECEVERDASGNVKQRGDVGPLLRERIGRYLEQRDVPFTCKYFDTSYLIRSVPANTGDSLLCDSLARYAVHAGMAGKTDVLVGHWHNTFVLVPIPAVIRRKKRLSPVGGIWTAVLSATGQPERFGPPDPAAAG
jgi:6-phosphofructokinase 1